MQVGRRSRLVAWLAAGAVLLQALWPLLSHARPKDPSLLVPVCTIDGVTHFLEIKKGKTPLEERSASHGEHCKLCVFGPEKPVAAGDAKAVFSPFETAAVRFLRTGRSDPPGFFPASARPRAPPAAS